MYIYKLCLSVSVCLFLVLDFRFHPSGDSLLSCSRDSLIRILDLRVLRPVQTHRLSWGPPAGGAPSGAPTGSSTGGGGAPQGGGGGPSVYGMEPTTLALNPAQPHIFCVGDTAGCLSFYSLLQPGGPLCRIDSSGQPQGAAGGPLSSLITSSSGSAGGPPSREHAIVALEWAPHGTALASASENRLLRLWGRGAPGAPIGKEINAGALFEVDGNGYSPVCSFRIEDRPIVSDKRIAAAAAATGAAAAPNTAATAAAGTPVSSAAGGPLGPLCGAPPSSSEWGDEEWIHGLPKPPKNFLLQFAERQTLTT